MQGLFKHTAGQSLRLVIFTAVSILLMYIDYKDDTLRGFKSAIGTAIIEPVSFIASLPSNIIGAAQNASTSRNTLENENGALKRQNQFLQTEILKLDGLLAENTRLRDLLNSSEQFNTVSTVAEIVAIDLDPFKQVITLNKGNGQKVTSGQAVIDAYGVMGQVTHTSKNASTTLLISDPGHSIPVQIQRNGLRTLANGTGRADELELMHIPTNAEIMVGDLVITSGLGGTFPKNYPVGTVTHIEAEPGRHFMQVKAKPSAQLNRSREVLILKQVKATEPESK